MSGIEIVPFKHYSTGISLFSWFSCVTASYAQVPTRNGFLQPVRQ